MATKGGEELKGDAVPVAIVAGAGGFIGSGAQRYCYPGMESLVAWFACFHGIVSAVLVVTILVAKLNKGDAYHMCQDDLCALVARTALIVWVEGLAGTLASSRAFTGWCSRVLSFSALLMVIVSVKLSVPFLHVALSGSYCCFGGDIVKVGFTVDVVVVGQLALSFWGAKVMLSLDPYRGHGQEQSKRG